VARETTKTTCDHTKRPEVKALDGDDEEPPRSHPLLKRYLARNLYRLLEHPPAAA
jgi:hypothetical protein